MSDRINDVDVARRAKSFVFALVLGALSNGTVYARQQQAQIQQHGIESVPLPSATVREFPAANLTVYNNSITKIEAIVDVDNGPTAAQRRRFHVLFGGSPADLTIDGTGRVIDDDTSNAEVQPAWVLESSSTPAQARGYAVARGWYPIIRTNIVRAVSDSTTFLVQVTPADASTNTLETHRVLLQEGASVRVYDSAGTLRFTLQQAGQYCEVARNADGSIDWARPIRVLNSEPGDAAANFRKYVNQLMARPAALELMKIPD